MHSLERRRTEFLDQDTVVRWALETTDRGLFDDEEFRDEDLAALYDRVSRGPGTRRSPT